MKRDLGGSNRTMGLMALSASAHMLIFAGLGFMPSPAEVLARHIANFEFAEPEPEPEPEVEPPEPEPEEPEPQRVVRRAVPRPVAEPEPEPEEAPPPEPVDFSGQTLTAEGGDSSWSTVVGDGSALRGPVGKIPTRQPRETRAALVEKAAPRVVSARSLSRKPKQPAGMDDMLQRNFPRRARMQGVEGDVVVRVKIMADGRVSSLKVRSESPGGWGFAQACLKTVRAAGRWRIPLDAQGKPVATVIKFPCRFEVRY